MLFGGRVFSDIQNSPCSNEIKGTIISIKLNGRKFDAY